MTESTESILKRLEALEKRNRELEDERQIRDLLSRYGYFADACKDDDYLALFTQDGAMDLSMGSSVKGYEAVTRWEGQKVLRDFISDPTAHHKPGFYGHSMHLQGNNLSITISGDEATAYSYSIVFHQQGPNLNILGGGNNRWLLQRVNEKWLIKERRRREVGNPDTALNLGLT